MHLGSQIANNEPFVRIVLVNFEPAPRAYVFNCRARNWVGIGSRLGPAPLGKEPGGTEPTAGAKKKLSTGKQNSALALVACFHEQWPASERRMIVSSAKKKGAIDVVWVQTACSIACSFSCCE